MAMSCYLQNLGIVNALGNGRDAVLEGLLAGRQAFVPYDQVPGKSTFVAEVSAHLADLPSALHPWRSRNLQLAITALEQIAGDIIQLRDHYGADRIAVVAGTSTSGIDAGEAAVREQIETGQRPENYHYRQQEIGNLAELVARHFALQGPAFTLSTACSSSAHALGSARRLLLSGLADAVVVGGADSLCRLTVNGFSTLESISAEPVRPFSRHRDGITIGEGAAFFLLTREAFEDRPLPPRLLAVGAASDAHHISAPDPAGKGALAAINMALLQAGITAEQVGYINLHGTGTPLNDAMEASVVAGLFPHQPWCSSSKGQIGHTLGAAGAMEAGICWLLLSADSGRLPPHVFDGHYDERLPEIRLVSPESRLETGRARIMLSNSFAFGGNNAAVVLAGN